MGFFHQVLFKAPTVLQQVVNRERLSQARVSHSYRDYLEKSFPVILPQTNVNVTVPFTAPGIGVAQLTRGHLLQQEILLDLFSSLEHSLLEDAYLEQTSVICKVLFGFYSVCL